MYGEDGEQTMYEDKAYPDGVRFILRAEPDDIPVRGNVVDSGDPDVDRKCEDEIIARLDQGDVWAWASVCVIARFDHEGQQYEGRDYLGACSYKDAADFTKPGGYWDDMKGVAYDDMRANIADAVIRGEGAARALKAIPTLDSLTEKAKAKR